MASIHGDLATTAAHQPEDPRATVGLATTGVEPTVSMEEVCSVSPVKAKYTHPDGAQDPEERRIREQRTQLLNPADEAIQKSRQRR